MLYTYFTSFTGYEYDIFRIISYLHVQGSKIGGKMDQFDGKKVNFAEFMEFVFSRSAESDCWCNQITDSTSTGTGACAPALYCRIIH